MIAVSDVTWVQYLPKTEWYCSKSSDAMFHVHKRRQWCLLTRSMAAKLESTPKSTQRSGSLESKDQILGISRYFASSPLCGTHDKPGFVGVVSRRKSDNPLGVARDLSGRLFWEGLPRRRLSGPGTSSVPARPYSV